MDQELNLEELQYLNSLQVKKNYQCEQLIVYRINNLQLSLMVVLEPRNSQAYPANTEVYCVN